MPWADELYDTPTRIYISAVFFFTLLISLIAGDEYALAYIVLTLLILHTPPALHHTLLSSHQHRSAHSSVP